MRTLLLGASGTLGRRVAGDLARAAPVTELVLAARREHRLAEVAALLGGAQVRSVDVADPVSLKAALDGVELVVNCAGPGYLTEEAAARACAAAGLSYLSVNADHEPVASVLALQGLARERGAVLVTGIGAAPGISNLLAALALDALDEPRELELGLAGSSADGGGEATLLHLLRELSAPAPVLADGRVITEAAGEAPRLVYFPEPVGWVETFRCGRPEVLTLPRRFPALEAAEARLGLTERATMDVLRAAAFTGMLRIERGRRTLLKLGARLRPLLEKMPPRGAPWTGIRVDVHGLDRGRPATVTYAIVDRLANMARLPLLLAVQALARGDITTGVHSPVAVFEPKAFFRALAAHGLRAARLEPEPV